MTRPEAARLVSERWERLLGMSPEEFPHVFSSDVDNMLAESGEAINQALEVAPQGVAGVSGSTEGRADEHKSDGQGEGEGRSNRANDSEATVRQTGRDCDCVKDLQLPNPKHYQLQVPTSGYQGPFADSQTFFSSLDHFTNRITRCVDKKLGQKVETERIAI
jgi:hypothetical protein